MANAIATEMILADVQQQINETVLKIALRFLS